MTTFLPGYRMTVYEPRSTQSAVTEPDILTATSPHTDPFKVASISGVSGFQPYLLDVSGRRGKIDPLTKRVTAGQLTVRLLDKKTGTSNLQRWVTAFLGDTAGRNQLLGCKVYVEESLDNGGSWSAFFVGRIDRTSLDDPLRYSLSIRDFTDDLNMDVFVGRPNAAVSYAAEPMLLPLGLTSTYGVITAAPKLSGSFGAAGYFSAGYRLLTVDAASIARLDNTVTAALLQQDYRMASTSFHGSAAWSVNPNPNLRVRFTGGGLTDKELRPVKFIIGKRADLTGYVAAIGVVALDSTDLHYTAFDTGTVPNATTCTFDVRQIQYDELGPSDAVNTSAPIYLTDQNPMDVWQDVLDGYFGRQYQPGDTRPTGKSVGDPVRAIPYDASGGSAFDKIANATDRSPLPLVRFRLTKPMKALEFFEKTGQFLGLSYRFQPAESGGVPYCRFVPVDLRLPIAAAIAGINTITDADLDTSRVPSWEQSRTDAVTQFRVDFYRDYRMEGAPADWTAAIKKALGQIQVPDIPVSLIDEVNDRLIYYDFGRALDLGDRSMTIDAFGLRGTVETTDVSNGLHSESLAERNAAGVIEFYRSQFGAGPLTLRFRARRTSNTSSLWPGDWVYLQANVLPDPATNVRGGTRLVQILERNEDGLTIEFAALDAGAGASCAVPTIGTPTQTSGATAHSIDVSVTLNAASEPVELRTNVQATSYGTSAPASTDPGWVYATRVTATGTAAIGGLPSGTRVFVQGRSVPRADGSADAPKLPSAWTGPSGTKYVDMASVTAPSAVTVLPSPILTGSTITATWTNGNSYLPILVQVYPNIHPSWIGTVGVYPAGSVGPVTLNDVHRDSDGTDLIGSSATYTVTVAHLDELGGTSAAGSTTFTTPAAFTGGTLSAPTLAILQGA